MANHDWMDALNHDPDLVSDEGTRIDEFIRSTKKELRRADAMMGETPPDCRPDPPERETPPPRAVYADSFSDEDEDEDGGEEEPPRARLATGWKVLIYVLSVLTVSILLAIVGWSCADDLLALTKPDRVVSVTISESDGAPAIAERLHKAGLVRYPWLFRFYCWFSHASDKIDPGTYELNNRYDYHALVNGMRGNTNRATDTVTIPEGYDCAQIFSLLEEKGVCSQAELYDAAANAKFDYSFLEGLPYGEDNRLEGYLFPDTYEFYVSQDVQAVPGEEAEQVLAKFLDNFEKKFDDTLLLAIDELNERLRAKMTAGGFSEEEIESAMMDEHKIVTVASLIEKETASASESDTIASVIYNRLASHDYPLLEIDATVLYALGERKEHLTNEDLMVDSPYNTRRYPGLPAGPIANPGLASLRAALYPEDTGYYFYALGGDGRHHFSETFQEHNDFLERMEHGE